MAVFPDHLRDWAWLAERLDAGMSTVEVAAEVGCHYTTVQNWINRHGLPRARRRDSPITVAVNARGGLGWLAEQVQLRTNDDIAAELGCSVGGVWSFRDQHGLR